MHKVDARMEAGEKPSQKIIQEMGKFVGGYLKAGVFKDGAGLHRSAARARIRFTGGTPSIERGPYAGGNELLASFAMVSTTGIEQAIALGTELGKAAGNCEVEVGPVVEGWDLNGSARPAGAPHRFLLLVKANAAFEAGAQQPAAVRSLLDTWQRDGLLQSEATLRPSKTAARVKTAGGVSHWTDGPFTESKELVAGFSILELPSLEAAKRLTEDYVAILGDTECDVREVAT
jgi:hypothetical protein